MTDQKVSELIANTSPRSDDELYIVNTQGGTPVSEKIDLDKLRTYSDVRLYGAALDNVADDSDAFEACHAATGAIYVPTGTARLATAKTYTSAFRLYMEPGATLRPDILSGNLFQFNTDDVHIMRAQVDGTGSTGTLTDNVRIFLSGNGTTKYYRHKYENIHINNCFLSDGLTEASNLLVTHGIFINNVDHVRIDHYYADTLSGAAIFCRDMRNFEFSNWAAYDCRWYNITLDDGCENGEVHSFECDCQLTEGVYYGGAVNLMSLNGQDRNAHISVHDFEIRGNMAYSVAVRILSITNCSVYDFKVHEWAAGSWALTNDLSAVRVETRGTSTASQNGPCHNVRIWGYDITAPTNTEDHRGIYCGNQWQTARNPATDIYIGPGVIRSTDTNDYFSEGIIFHGFSGGFEGVTIFHPTVINYGQASPVVGGAIGFVGSNAGGAVTDVYIYGGRLTGLGTPSGSQEVGISIGAYTDRVYQMAPARIDNYFYGVRTLTNSGPTLEALDAQSFDTNTTDTLFGVGLSRYGQELTGSATWNPGNIADGDEQTQTVTVTGAALGDFVTAVSFSLDVSDLQLTADVTVANQVTCVLSNSTGGNIDLAEGTVRVRVNKAGSGE